MFYKCKSTRPRKKCKVNQTKLVHTNAHSILIKREHYLTPYPRSKCIFNDVGNGQWLIDAIQFERKVEHTDMQLLDYLF